MNTNLRSIVARLPLTAVALVATATLAGCAAQTSDANTTDEPSASSEESALRFPPIILSCPLTPTQYFPWDGVHETVTQAENRTGAFLGTNYKGCPTKYSYDQLSVGLWGLKHKLRLTITPKGGETVARLTATRAVLLPNGSTSHVVDLLIDTESPSAQLHPLSTVLDLDQQYERFDLSVRSVRTAIQIVGADAVITQYPSPVAFDFAFE